MERELTRNLTASVNDVFVQGCYLADTASDFDEQPDNPYALGAERSASRYDQRHRFVASALFELLIGDEEDNTPGEVPVLWTKMFSNIEVMPVLTIDSRRPVNPLTGAADSHSLALPLPARPLGAARNSLRLPMSATMDLRILKFFTIKPQVKLDLAVEAFNVSNRVNGTQLNYIYGGSTTPAATFGRATDAAAARRMQFAIDFEF